MSKSYSTVKAQPSLAFSLAAVRNGHRMQARDIWYGDRLRHVYTYKYKLLLWLQMWWKDEDFNLSYVYWTVHHWFSWRIKDQLGRIVLASMCVGFSVWLGWSGIRVAGWSKTSCVSACNTDTTPTHIEQRTIDQCGNSTEYSQAPDDGYINVQNMLST